jgi:hypothetical protein
LQLVACTPDSNLHRPTSDHQEAFLAYTALREAFWFEGDGFAANTEDHDFAIVVSGLVEGLVGERQDQDASGEVGEGFERVSGVRGWRAFRHANKLRITEPSMLNFLTGCDFLWG